MKAIASLMIVISLAAGELPASPRIALRVPEWGGTPRDEVVTSGIPLAKGALKDKGQCRLLNVKGNEVPFASTVLARWPDGSVKWLLLDIRAKVGAHETGNFVLECGVKPSVPGPGSELVCAGADGFIEVTTGPLRFRVRRGASRQRAEFSRYTFLDAVWLDRNGDGTFSDDESILVPGRGDSQFEIETARPGPPQEENWLVNAGGGPRKRFGAVIVGAKIELRNSLRTVVVARGEYRNEAGETIGPFWTRYTAWAGSAVIGVEHFFAFDADVEKAFLRTLSLGLQLAGDAPLLATFGLDGAKSFQPDAALSETALVQVMPDRFYHLVPLSIDRRVRWQVVGKRDDGTDKTLKEGVEATGWVSLESGRGTTTIAMRDFSRLHPKEVRVEPARRSLRYYLWPDRGNKVLDLRRRYKGQRIDDHYDTGEYGPAGRGFGKTHQMLIEFRPNKTDTVAALSLARRANEPLRAFCTPQHYASCDVWNQFHPADAERFPMTEALIRLGTEWALRLPRLFHWDGIVDWGDTLFQGYEGAPHRQVKNVPKTSWVVRGYDGWLNNDCNVAHDFMIYFLRSGDDRLFRYWERMVQHIMDVDTIHAAEDPTHVGGGRRHDQQHWGATYTGYGTAAVEAGELYYLTGSLWAREMLVKYADWYMVGGGSEWETRVPCLALAWEATGDEKYMQFIQRPAMRTDVYGLMMGKRGAIDLPHWRTTGVELGVDFLYRATGDAKWRDHLVTAARRFIEANPGNQYGRSLLAKAYLATGDEQILDWMRRLMVVASPYQRAVWQRFFRTNEIPDDLRALSWDELTEIARKVGMADVRTLIYTFRYYPYVMAALAKAGLDEQQMELVDFALDRRGMGQYHLRGPDVPKPTDSHYEPISLESIANSDPLADPFGKYEAWKRRPLKPDQIGFDFGEWGECDAGYFPVRPATHYPYRAPIPRPTEHDGTNLIGLPFGTIWYANNVRFALPDPASATDGKTMLVVGKGERVAIPIGKKARKLHVLGHVCRALSNWQEVGARYHLNYADGTSRTIDLTNLIDYENIFQWGFSKKAMFARNWKAQGGWDGGAPILNNYPIACEDKELKELVVEDTGKGIGFVIVAVTAEVAGATDDKPLLDISFRASGASKRRWEKGADHGWLDVTGKLQESGGVRSDAAATFRAALEDGLYEVELELAGSGWSSPFNIRANGHLAVRGYVASSGCIPGAESRADRIRFPVQVQDGKLDLTLEADRTVGNWRHPSRLRGLAWHLGGVSVFPGKRKPAAKRRELAYGWLERDLSCVRLPDRVTSRRDALLHNCMRARSERGTFRVDLEPGGYEVELIFAVRGSGTRERPVKMDVSLQGKRVLRNIDGGSYAKTSSHTFPVQVGRDGHLELTLERFGEENEWGINAMVVRRKE